MFHALKPDQLEVVNAMTSGFPARPSDLIQESHLPMEETETVSPELRQ